MPGSLCSSSINLDTGCAVGTESIPKARFPLHARQLQTSSDSAQALLGQLLRFLHGFIDGRQHQVFQQAHVIGVNGFRRYLDGLELLIASDHNLHSATAGTYLQIGVSQLLLGLGQLRLHVLYLAHEVLVHHLLTSPSVIDESSTTLVIRAPCSKAAFTRGISSTFRLGFTSFVLSTHRILLGLPNLSASFFSTMRVYLVSSILFLWKSW